MARNVLFLIVLGLFLGGYLLFNNQQENETGDNNDNLSQEDLKDFDLSGGETTFTGGIVTGVRAGEIEFEKTELDKSNPNDLSKALMEKHVFSVGGDARILRRNIATNSSSRISLFDIQNGSSIKIEYFTNGNGDIDVRNIIVFDNLPPSQN